MNYNMYLDESGNTGDIKYNKNDKSWNYDRQEYFALGSITVPENKVEELTEEIERILRSYDKELGKTKELKAKAKYKFKEELLKEIIDKINDFNIKIYIDISNKRYKVITYIIEYCIYPYYTVNNKYTYQNKVKHNDLATKLYNELSDEMISEFIDICLEKSDFETGQSNIERLIEYIEKLKKFVNDDEINGIEKVKSVLKKYDLSKFDKEKLFPVKDKTNKGSDIYFLPNLDAYLNIVASITTLNLRNHDKLMIYHDNQKQFDNSIKNWTSIMKEEFMIRNIENVEFVDSKSDVLVQIIDFITGTSLNCFIECMKKGYLDFKTRKLIKILKPILKCCNIVTNRAEEYKFERNCNIKLYSTQLPRV